MSLDEARVTTARYVIVRALLDQFGPWKCAMMACMIDIEMGTDEQVNSVGKQAKQRELFHHIAPHDWSREARWKLEGVYIGRQTAVDQDVSPVSRLNEITDDWNTEWW